MRLTPQRVFILLILGMALLIALAFRSEPREAPQATQGIIDLREIDFAQSPATPLAGTWNFYWKRFVPPAEFSSPTPPTPDALLQLPGNWSNLQVDGQPIDGRGTATLHLRLTLAGNAPPLALRLYGFFPANRIWVNGLPLARSGSLGLDSASERMEHGLQFVPLPVGAKQLDLVIHVSNFQLPKEKVSAILIGRASELQGTHIRLIALSMFSAGTLLLMGFYHLALFFYRPQNRAALYLAIYCLLWTIYVLNVDSSDEALRLFWPELSGEFVFRIWRVCLFAVTPIAYLFYRALYPDEFAPWVTTVLVAVAGIYVPLGLFAPIDVLYQAMPYFFLITLARLIYTAWGLWRAMQRQREGARIIFNGFVSMIAFSINDMLNGIGAIDTPLMLHLGMIVYMFTQALALAIRFSRLFDSVEGLSTELMRQNTSLESEIAQRTRLQQEVVSVSEEERRRMSHELHDGLCQLLTAARLQAAGLARVLPPNPLERTMLGKLSDLLDASTDKAYELSRGLWPVERDTRNASTALASLSTQLARPEAAPIGFSHLGACAQCSTRIAPPLYGIGREAATNAVKHAHATDIRIELDCRQRPQIELRVQDNGKGCRVGPDDTPGLGLRIMAYRAQTIGGKISIEHPATGGTEVRCILPCPDAAPR